MTTIAEALQNAADAVNENAALYFAMKPSLDKAVQDASDLVITTGVVKSVHGAGADFTDLNVAIEWLSRRRVAFGGFVTLQLAAGVEANAFVYNQDIVFQHPDGERIRIQGALGSGPMPAASTLAVAGTTDAQREASIASNLYTLRSIFKTEIRFAGGHGFRGSGTIERIKDLLITSDGTGVNVNNFSWSTGYVLLHNVASVGAKYINISISSGRCSTVGAVIALGGTIGIQASENAAIVAYGPLAALHAKSTNISAASSSSVSCDPNTPEAALLSRGGGSFGVLATAGGSVNANAISLSSDNAGSGFAAYSGKVSAVGAAANNNEIGFLSYFQSYVDASNTSGTNRVNAYAVFHGSLIARGGGTATGGAANTNLAIGTVGNNNSLIV